MLAGVFGEVGGGFVLWVGDEQERAWGFGFELEPGGDPDVGGELVGIAVFDVGGSKLVIS